MHLYLIACYPAHVVQVDGNQADDDGSAGVVEIKALRVCRALPATAPQVTWTVWANSSGLDRPHIYLTAYQLPLGR